MRVQLYGNSGRFECVETFQSYLHRSSASTFISSRTRYVPYSSRRIFVTLHTAQLQYKQVAKVIVATGRIAAEHGSFSRISRAGNAA